MLDRASSLQDPVVLKYLATRFVPAAVDQHIHRTLKDAEGELFARVLKQAGRGLGGTSQGNYLFTPDGKLLAFANTADAAHVRRLMETALKKFDPATAPAVEAGPKAALPQFEPPAGGLVLDVTSKVLGGYEKGGNRAMRDAVGRDHLWLRKDEAEALARGELPESVKQRLARFHLIDNTRGEPPLWRPDEVKRLELTLKDGRLSGSVHLETKAGNRGYQADLLGVVEVNAGRVTRLDLVAKGAYWGEGNFTRGAPPGRFPFAVAFTLSPGTSAADRVLPGAARSNLKGYLR
ncbi:MAG TPA: hypothetical protein VEL76_33255 [Gemmataceae bacterium]|nr:hypothetical protein [Gemmataceae bacterium]